MGSCHNFQFGAGIERARYKSLVRFFSKTKTKNLSYIHTDGEINRDDKKRSPNVVFCRVSRNFAAVKNVDRRLEKGLIF